MSRQFGGESEKQQDSTVGMLLTIPIQSTESETRHTQSWRHRGGESRMVVFVDESAIVSAFV